MIRKSSIGFTIKVIQDIVQPIDDLYTELKDKSRLKRMRKEGE